MAARHVVACAGIGLRPNEVVRGTTERNSSAYLLLVGLRAGLRRANWDLIHAAAGLRRENAAYYHQEGADLTCAWRNRRGHVVRIGYVSSRLEDLRILHLGKFYPPYRGGIETYVRSLAIRQSRTNLVEVVVSNVKLRAERTVVEGVHITRLPKLGTIASMPVCLGLTSAIRRQPAAIVHMHTPNPLAALAFLRSGHRGKLVITHHADTLKRKWLRRLSDPYVYRAMERASAIVVTSNRYLQFSAELAPFREKCRVIPLGIELEDGEHSRAISRISTDQQRPIVLAVGRLVPYKGFDVLIRAMRQVDAELHLVGAGPEKKNLEALAEGYEVQNKVRFLGRVEDLRSEFESAAIFVLPSVTRAEAFGIAQLEAMAAGIPVINTNVESGVPEVSIHGETGLTVEPGDEGGLAAAMRVLLTSHDLRESMGRAAKARVHSEFTADLMAERTLQLYKDILSEA